MVSVVSGRRISRVVLAALLVGGFSLGVPAANAAPAAPAPPRPSAPDLPEGPWPPSRVLAAVPSTVPPPTSVFSATATTCPPVGYGVNHYAPGSGKTVALTFDDGPGPNTARIMQILEDNGVAATFFNIGVNQAVKPSTVSAEYGQRFLLGNHTWDHPDMATEPAATQAAEIDKATAEQVSITGSTPCFFRPPYGSYNSTTLSLAQARHLSVWNWSVDTEDWKAQNSASSFWVSRIISRAEAGVSQSHPVILMHNAPSGDAATVAALQTIINFYRDHGYLFVDLMGRVADRPVTGDWDGNGTTTIGVVRGNTWYLRNSNTPGAPDVVFQYGGPTDRVVTGDWDGNGTTTPGVVRGNMWFLRNSNTPGIGNVQFSYAGPDDRPVTGDWDGNGTTTIGVVRGNTWYLRNSNSTGPGLAGFTYGGPSDRPVTGDWDGNGTTTVGIVRESTWYLRNSNSSGPGLAGFGFGGPTDRPLTGDWEGHGTTTIGVNRGANWYLRSTNTGGDATTQFAFRP